MEWRVFSILRAVSLVVGSSLAALEEGRGLITWLTRGYMSYKIDKTTIEKEQVRV